MRVWTGGFELEAPSRGRSAVPVTEDVPWRIAYLVTHPIQYQAPLLRRLNREPDLEITALFRSDFSTRSHTDPGFGERIRWDVPLLDGYPYVFLPAIGDRDRFSFWRPLSYGLFSKLRRGDYDVLWIHGFGHAYHLYAMTIARLLGIPVFLRDEVHERSRRRTWRDAVAATLLYWFLRTTVSRFLAIGTANRRRYLAMGVRPEKVALVPYAVDNEFFGVTGFEAKRTAKAKLASRLGFEADQPVILFAGKLQRRKRCADLIAAFLDHGVAADPSRPILLVAGEGEDMSVCRQLVANSAFANSVQFLGFQNQRALVELYGAADIFVLASDSEAWGLTINEAMSAGCAILASDELGSVPDLLREGENGYTCRAGDVGGQADQLLRMLSSPATLESMGRKSLHLIERWSFEEDLAGLRDALQGEFRGS